MHQPTQWVPSNPDTIGPEESALRSASPSLDRVFGTVPSVATAFSYDGTESFI